MHPQICLYQPEIPQNTGTIARLAAATQCKLHLIKPLGFSIEDKYVRRAGLDYWPFVDLSTHENIDEIMSSVNGPQEVAFLSKKATKTYTEIESDVKFLIFGQETKGLPDSLWEKYPERFFQIPIYSPHVRSLNLANAVSIVVYDQLMRVREPRSIE